MNLDQVINFFSSDFFSYSNGGNKHAAYYFESMRSEPQVVDGYIELEVVKRYCLSYSDKLWRSVQANVTTYVGCTF